MATYSKGAGGAFGVRARTDGCAVEGCTNQPKPHVCLYDGSRHRHGAIHYWCDRAKPTSLTFREEGWFWICDEHYEHLKDELQLREESDMLNRFARKFV